jgi:hypothetical protein
LLRDINILENSTVLAMTNLSSMPSRMIATRLSAMMRNKSPFS